MKYVKCRKCDNRIHLIFHDDKWKIYYCNECKLYWKFHAIDYFIKQINVEGGLIKFFSGYEGTKKL